MDPDWRPLSPKLLTMWRLTATLTFAVLTAVGTAAAATAGGGTAVVAALLVAAAALAHVWRLQTRRFRAWAYATRDRDLLLRRGVVVQRTSVVPYGRMQFVDVAQGPLDRRFGIASVVLHTAAAATDAHLPGLTAEDATSLRDRLAELGEAHAAGL